MRGTGEGLPYTVTLVVGKFVVPAMGLIAIVTYQMRLSSKTNTNTLDPSQ